MLTADGRPVLSFSGTIKRVKRNIPTIIPE
jgi:hypothetical protein